MAIVIEPYREEHQAAMQEFNRRLQAAGGGPDLVFYRSSQPHWLPRVENSSLYNEYFVAVEGTVVRGAYALKHEKILVGGSHVHSVACYHHPLSEGVVSRPYAAVGGLMLRDALKRQPKLYALGMGGLDRPLARMVAAMGWRVYLVPFYFRVLHPYRFLRQMRSLREARWRSFLMDLGAVTGVGPVALRALQGAARLRSASPKPFTAEPVDGFGEWADNLWLTARSECSMTPVRDAATLKILYPSDDKHFTRLRIGRNGEVLGWTVVGERRKDAKFGNLRVGSVIDCWAASADKLAVLLAATEALEAQGMDLIVANHSHQAWGQAFKSAGYLNGPSNFVFAASKELTELLQSFDQNKPSFHITRADGDGLPRNF